MKRVSFHTFEIRGTSRVKMLIYTNYKRQNVNLLYVLFIKMQFVLPTKSFEMYIPCRSFSWSVRIAQVVVLLGSPYNWSTNTTP